MNCLCCCSRGLSIMSSIHLGPNPMAHFLKLYDGEGSRRTDALVREALNISGFELMQRAASAACDDLLNTWPNAKHVAVWCGKGNNGGDGYLLAKLLHARGVQVEVVSLMRSVLLRWSKLQFVVLLAP